MAETAMQGASCESEAIWGSVSCSRSLRHAAQFSLELRFEPATLRSLADLLYLLSCATLLHCSFDLKYFTNIYIQSEPFFENVFGLVTVPDSRVVPRFNVIIFCMNFFYLIVIITINNYSFLITTPALPSIPTHFLNDIYFGGFVQSVNRVPQ